MTTNKNQSVNTELLDLFKDVLTRTLDFYKSLNSKSLNFEKGDLQKEIVNIKEYIDYVNDIYAKIKETCFNEQERVILSQIQDLITKFEKIQTLFVQLDNDNKSDGRKPDIIKMLNNILDSEIFLVCMEENEECDSNDCSHSGFKVEQTEKGVNIYTPNGICVIEGKIDKINLTINGE